MERICDGQGVPAPPERVRHGPAIARMCCTLWWRRKLRRHQGRTVEAAAIHLGDVHKFRDLYVSNERLAARLQQHARNAAALEATLARNEIGEEFTLAELAATSVSNKAIRRAAYDPNLRLREIRAVRGACRDICDHHVPQPLPPLGDGE